MGWWPLSDTRCTRNRCQWSVYYSDWHTYNVSFYDTNFWAAVYVQVPYAWWATLNLSAHSAAYMRQRIRSELVEIMACRLFGAKPLSTAILGYSQLDPEEEKKSLKFNQHTELFIHKMLLNILSTKWRPSCRGGYGLTENCLMHI